jgi:hypothetical protein
MKISNKENQQDEPHTITISYIGDGQGKTETYYYGEAKAPIESIKDFSQMRFTKGASIDEILADFTWKAKIKKLINKLTKSSE